MKKLLILMTLITIFALILTLSTSAAFERTKTYEQGQFTDVAADAWYAQSVKDCYEMGLVNGSSATTYEPDGYFSLAQAATIAARMHSIYNGGNGVIPTAEGEWFMGAVNYCIENGIFDRDTYSNFNRRANRSEMAMIMYSALSYEAWPPINEVRAIPDVSNENKAKDAIFTLYRAGVFTGSDGYGTFNPYSPITRAEVAALVARMADNSLRKSFTLIPLSQKPIINIDADYFYVEDGIIKTEKDGLYGLIRMDGTVLYEPQFRDIKWIKDGYICVQNGKKYGVTDYNGAIVMPFEYSMITYLGDGFMQADRYVYLEGNRITPENQSPYLMEPDNRLIKREKVFSTDANGLKGVVDAYGTVIVPSQKAFGISWGDGFFVVHTGFNNSGGKVYDGSGKGILFELSEDYSFTVTADSKLMAIRNKDKKYAVASAKGVLSDFAFDYVSLTGDIAIVTVGDKNSVYNTDGIIPGDYGSNLSAHNNVFYAVDEATTTLYDKNGTELAKWEKSHLGYRTTAFRELDELIAYGDWYPELIYDKVTGESYINQNSYYYENGERKFANNGVRATEFFEASHPQVFGTSYVYKGLNGKYGYLDLDSTGTTPVPIYETPEDAVYYGKYANDFLFVRDNPYLPVYRTENMGAEHTLVYGCERLGYTTLISNEDGYNSIEMTIIDGVFTAVKDGKKFIIFM